MIVWLDRQIGRGCWAWMLPTVVIIVLMGVGSGLLLAGCAERVEVEAASLDRQILCRGPIDNIPADDPGLVLFNDVETLDDERTNACDPEERR